MRPTALATLSIGFALLAGAQQAAAQSAYDYPICAIYTNRSGATACYYRTRAECMATMSGIGGYCIESPYYRGPRPAPRDRSRNHRY